MIRPATPRDAEAIARVHVAAWAETYAGIIPAEVLARQDPAERAQRWRAILEGAGGTRHRAAVAVALDDEGRVVGFASCGEARDDALLGTGITGEVSAIYLLGRHQRRGIGRALMGWAARTLAARGHASLGLWVVRDNPPARAFYGRLGGVPVAEKDDEIAGVPVVEVAYGWTAIAALAASAPSR